ncbi:MAG: FHA domain-containing protein [Chloroflexota bacterium]
MPAIILLRAAHHPLNLQYNACMSGILVLVLRILFTLLLFAFLYWAFHTIWRDLRFKTQELTPEAIPALLISRVDLSEGDIIRFQTSEVIVGREAGCHLTLPDDTVSARHARFTFQQNQWWVEDLNSTNGSYLNGEKLTTRAVIVSGDEIRCGQAVFRIEIEPKKSSH